MAPRLADQELEPHPEPALAKFCGCHPESPVLTGLAGDSDTREPPISGLKIVKLACFLRSHCPEFQGETPDCLCFLFFLKVTFPLCEDYYNYV